MSADADMVASAGGRSRRGGCTGRESVGRPRRSRITSAFPTPGGRCGGRPSPSWAPSSSRWDWSRGTGRRALHGHRDHGVDIRDVTRPGLQEQGPAHSGPRLGGSLRPAGPTPRAGTRSRSQSSAARSGALGAGGRHRELLHAAAPRGHVPGGRRPQRSRRRHGLGCEVGAAQGRCAARAAGRRGDLGGLRLPELQPF